MQKVMSARVDESVMVLVEEIAHERKMSKKRIIEKAIREFWQKTQSEKKVDYFQNTFGAWKRDESVEETVRRSRNAFNQSMHRYHLE